MIKSLRLENFQAHKDSTFEFDNRLNIIVGSSNQGKTSCARALSLVIYNTWDKSWVRVGSVFCKITLTMDNGVTVVREKGEKVNKYILQVPNQLPQEFVNFGTEVPEAVSKLLHIEKIVLDKDDSLTLNYASQLEPLFLFNRSGSQKAKVFGRLSGAQYLDHALRNLNTEKKQISVEKNLKIKELEELQTQHTALSKVFDFAPAIMRFIGEEMKIEEHKQRLEGVKSLFLRTQDWKRRYTSESEREAVLSKAVAVELAPVEVSILRLKQLKQLLNRKNDILDREAVLIVAKNQYENEFRINVEEYTTILSKNKVCPTCFNPLDSQKLDEIKNNLVGNEKCLVNKE